LDPSTQPKVDPTEDTRLCIVNVDLMKVIDFICSILGGWGCRFSTVTRPRTGQSRNDVSISRQIPAPISNSVLLFPSWHYSLA